MNTYTQNLIKAREKLGSYSAIGDVCGVSDTSVKKWRDNGRPPRTEYTGETHYAALIEVATNGHVKAVDLLPAIKTSSDPKNR